MDALRKAIRAATFADEDAHVHRLISDLNLSHSSRARISNEAARLVKAVRDGSDPTMMELFLAEYGLSTDEGVALMCLAEALLRVPDAETIDALIEDKIVPSAWGEHLGQSHSPLVNASTWALLLTGKVLDDDRGVTGPLRRAIKRLGEPVIRTAVRQAMKEMGRQFVLGETIEAAMARARDLEVKGYTYSYDMLGEAAMTARDAKRYHIAYADAISEIARAATAESVAYNPGISIKLSALHPRYEALQHDRVRQELVPRVASLATLAKSAGIGLNIDAEEADRLDLSLTVIEAVLKEPSLSGWDGFGVVVQAYSRRAPSVLDWLHALAERLDRRIMVRLVKGAYWDTEIKHAQVEGRASFPVFSRKAATDVSYLACAKKLFAMADRIYPQFATHNAHTVAGVIDLAPSGVAYEFQRLHGMGEALHETVKQKANTRCRIYAPVGAHKDLLAYLVRRLLENGANSSFVNQIVDETLPPEDVGKDPIEEIEGVQTIANPGVRESAALYAPERANSAGYDLGDLDALDNLRQGIAAALPTLPQGGNTAVESPLGEVIAHTDFMDAEQVAQALATTKMWDASVAERAAILRKAADFYERDANAIFALLMKGAGKTLTDCIAELREAVDFLRYYSAEAEARRSTGRGVFSCISPWNFPLAIFTGQIAAALAAGNGVVAKPAETTTLIAAFAVDLLHEAGVPKDALTLAPGKGSIVGPVLTGSTKVAGVAFTGSTATAKRINRTMAVTLPIGTPLIAETGGLNAMVVDSTALPEQAVRDIVASAFQSAGQRCSALRCLYVQDDVADTLLEMLYGAMDAMVLGDPSDFSTDVGPLIDAAAQTKVTGYIDAARAEGRLLKQLNAPSTGYFVGPAVIKVSSIKDMREEIFGPVLHIATFGAEDVDAVINAVNATGYGLTFGLHSRIDDRVQHIIDRVNCGNIYVNRNQIGAIVGSQPFGGHGMSGTGPKAGGPRYLARFESNGHDRQLPIERPAQLPGPTGESNTYVSRTKHYVLCVGAEAEAAAMAAHKLGVAKVVAVENPGEADLHATDLDAVICWGEVPPSMTESLAARDGAIVPVYSDRNLTQLLFHEQVVSIDTTASGGNAELLAASC